jgi:hypothetical protein
MTLMLRVLGLNERVGSCVAISWASSEAHQSLNRDASHSRVKTI